VTNGLLISSFCNREIIPVCTQIHIKHKNLPCGQNVIFFIIKTGGIYIDLLPVEGKISVLKSNQLTLYTEIVAVYSQIPTKHI
jgi:hypothetical protein